MKNKKGTSFKPEVPKLNKNIEW